MIILRTGKSSIVLGFTKILKLASIDCLFRAIDINWLNVTNIWLWKLANHHKCLTFIFILDFIVTIWWSCNKTKFPLEFPVTFGLTWQHYFVYSVTCFSMPACLQPIPIHTVVGSMNLLRWTCYNYTGTTPTSYHKVFEPCGQTLIGTVGTQL